MYIGINIVDNMTTMFLCFVYHTSNVKPKTTSPLLGSPQIRRHLPNWGVISTDLPETSSKHLKSGDISLNEGLSWQIYLKPHAYTSSKDTSPHFRGYFNKAKGMVQKAFKSVVLDQTPSTPHCIPIQRDSMKYLNMWGNKSVITN